MSETITVEIIAFFGTLIGTLGGIIAASKLTLFRIERLEEEVRKHNSLIERTYKLEGKVEEIVHEIKDLKG